ncbi:MAG: PASTA domain-containing protein [Bacteroidales bacterium]|nr:PASTA domain-containing protein [Bacteroidales bacterium]
MKISNFFSNIFIKNILLSIAVFLIIVFVVLGWLNRYTNHGQQVEVPDVRGMQVADAAPFFQQRTLRYEVIDSTFVKNKAPGSILETIPPVKTNVKAGRTIYITINAYTAQLLAIPSVKDMSQRQALAILRSLGFESIDTKIVPGAYKDLVLGLEGGGRTLEPGERIPADTPVYILVSSGEVENIFESIETEQDTTPEESWF